MKRKFTYISLFSGGGVGCFGFQQQGFDCIATNEVLDKRLEIQKYNSKCKYNTGYISGDITDPKITEQLFSEIENYKKKEKINDVDVVIATPPCQGMSVANHKKDNGDIYRNSLVVDAIKIVERILPKFFVFENVRSFLNTQCYEGDSKIKIKDSIHNNLSKDYVYHSEVLNLKQYGSNSSRTRTLVIGVRKDYANVISPLSLFPKPEDEKKLEEVIGDLPRLTTMGEIHEEDIFHSFKPYRKDMRDWIKDLKPGQSAFDNDDIKKIPHRIIDGEIVINKNKNADKYKRQEWNKVGACIHTRNDILASQNTVHPEDDRVFSIRELMLLMSIPRNFKWSDLNENELNRLPLKEKKKFLKENEMNIRQCIGEGVPTRVMEKIAFNIKNALEKKKINEKEIRQLIQNHDLMKTQNIIKFIEEESSQYHFYDLLKIVEISNVLREEKAAYYTDLEILHSLYNELPDLVEENVRILEPSVGAGNFIPLLIYKYRNNKNVVIDVCDIDEDSIQILKVLMSHFSIPSNIKINFYVCDYLNTNFPNDYDLIIGNPPFLNITISEGLGKYREKYDNEKAKNLSAFFLDKSLNLSKNVVFILPKYFLHNENFSISREKVKNFGILSIIDFGEQGFKGVLIETIAIVINTQKKNRITKVVSIKEQKTYSQYTNKLTDSRFPNWIIYRNDFFDELADEMMFDIFSVYRDRQITKKMTKKRGEVRVLKSRNLSIDGEEIINIDGYDEYVDMEAAKELTVFKNFFNRDDVYLVPNMTYYPRMFKKPKDVIMNGSIAILELKRNVNVTQKDMKFFSSKIFREFYAIARNKSTRSLNIDNNSVYYFGLRKKR